MIQKLIYSGIFFFNCIGACVEIFCDDSKEFKGLFFQDKEMIAVFDAYPEMIFVDAT
jgi:hypothetical protein